MTLELHIMGFIITIICVFIASTLFFPKKNKSNGLKNVNVLYDILFVGAGPANISAAHYLNINCPNIKFLIVDSGKNVTKRDHNSSVDCVNGIGGAGLFSDGKFSWYPAGTQVWKLPRHRLLKSYKFLQDLLGPFINKNNNSIPDFPDNQEDFVSDNNWKLKSYITHYLTLEERKQLAINMTINYYDSDQTHEKHSFLLRHKVIDYKKINVFDNFSYYNVRCENIETKAIVIVKAKHIVFGGGRFMPVWLKQLGITSIFKRIELGVRFAGPADSDIYSVSSNVDPKFMKTDEINKIQYRSFCTCRDGENVVTNCNNIETWSGRSDCASTGESNFGFNLVFKDSKYLELLEFAKSTKPFEIKMKDIYKLEDPVIAAKVGNYLQVLKYIKNGLESFIEFTKIPKEKFMEFYLRGPTIEGVGFYPIITRNLRIPNENIWIVGDCTGIFRGIIASMLSGIYVADLIAEKLSSPTE